MKLLVDQNLSPDLIGSLSDLFPDSLHVFQILLDEAEDIEIWGYARENDFVFVTKDTDYRDLSQRRGFPPKVILILSGNGPTQQVAELLRDNVDLIQRFETDRTTGIIEMG